MDKLTMGERIVLAAGTLLVIDLIFLPWHSIDNPFGGGNVTAQAIEDPNGFYGILALLLVVVMIVQIVVAKFTSAKLPDLPISWGQVHMVAGIAVAALLLLKLIVETDFLGFGAYLGILLGAAVAFGGFTINKESPAAAGGTRGGTLPPPV